MAAKSSAATKSAESAQPELTITRVLDAPRDLVFRVWTRPEHLVRWWGPAGFTLPQCKMDLRPGGAFHYIMRSGDEGCAGTHAPNTEHRLRGVLREIKPPERLVFTWAWEDENGQLGHETLVTVTMTEQGSKTKLTLHQAVFESVTARDAHNAGWSECMLRLTAYVESL
jgi:uncharacterized protein YndB with AHSA1/START domain